eukprot:1003219-Pelagomonas_calceolata.AAC.1
MDMALAHLAQHSSLKKWSGIQSLSLGKERRENSYRKLQRNLSLHQLRKGGQIGSKEPDVSSTTKQEQKGLAENWRVAE